MGERYTTNKLVSNPAKHGVELTASELFDWDSAFVRADVRSDYPEPRLVAMGLIGPRLHVLVFTVEGRVARIISLRKANNREITRYERERP